MPGVIETPMTLHVIYFYVKCEISLKINRGNDRRSDQDTLVHKCPSQGQDTTISTA
jgi:hypothetical protein